MKYRQRPFVKAGLTIVPEGVGAFQACVLHHGWMGVYPESVEQRLAIAPAEYATSARELLPAAEELGLVASLHNRLYERVLHALLDLAAGDLRALQSLSELARSDWRDVLATQEEQARRGHPTSDWGFSDAWIYTAIRISDEGDGVLLADLLKAADATNHAIPTKAEVTQAIRRLVGAGLVAVRGERFQLTAAAATFNPKRRGGLFGQIDSDLRALRRLPVIEADWTYPGDPQAT